MVHSVVPEADFPTGSGFVSRQASIPDGFKGKEAAAARPKMSLSDASRRNGGFSASRTPGERMIG
jgi:hypothetical protein